MRILFAGTPEAARPTLHKLINSEHQVVAVVTRPDAPTGRGRTMAPSIVAQVASDAGLSVFKAASLNDAALIKQISDLQPDLAVIVAYGALIKEPLLNAFPWVNLHFSLLPSYRGAAPVQHAILAGEEITGVSAFILDNGLDTGPLLGQMTERIRPNDTSGTLLQRLSEGGADLMMALLTQWEEITAQPQPDDGVSFAPKIDVGMARIDWGRSGELIDRHIRAMTPSPGAWTTIHNERLEILEASLADDSIAAGQVKISKHEILIGSSTRAVRLLKVKPAGRREMAAIDWARGQREAIHFQ